MVPALNVAHSERWASAVGGAALVMYGLKRRSMPGSMMALSGTALLLRGATGHCPMYAAIGVTTADQSDTRTALAGDRGIAVEQAVTIRRGAEELYRFWRDFENLPRFMPSLVSVTSIDERRSHWVAKARAGRTVEWDAEIVNEIPNELIAWRTLARADVISAGSVAFQPTRSGTETAVHVKLQYEPPAGRFGAALAWMLGREPSQTIREDLRRFKAIVEAGESPTAEGQPRGRSSMLNYT